MDIGAGMDKGVPLLWVRNISLKSPLESVFPFVLLWKVLSSGIASLGGFEAPQISWHEDPGWLSYCFPGSKSHLRYSGSISCDFCIFIASMFQILFIRMLWFNQSELSDVEQTPVQASIKSRILYHRLSSFRLSKDVNIFLIFPLENILHCPAVKYAQHSCIPQ